MFTTTRFSGAIFSIALVAGMIGASAPARAAVDMYVGPPELFSKTPLADCSTKAKDALGSVLTSPFEAGAGTGQWLAQAAPDANGDSHASAAIHCFPIGDGFVVSMTCAVEIRSDQPTASDLCAKISKAFGTP